MFSLFFLIIFMSVIDCCRQITTKFSSLNNKLLLHHSFHRSGMQNGSASLWLSLSKFHLGKSLFQAHSWHWQTSDPLLLGCWRSQSLPCHWCPPPHSHPRPHRAAHNRAAGISESEWGERKERERMREKQESQKPES